MILILQLDGAYVALDVVSPQVDAFKGADDIAISELGLFVLLNVEGGRKISIADCDGIACLKFSWHEACIIVN